MLLQIPGNLTEYDKVQVKQQISECTTWNPVLTHLQSHQSKEQEKVQDTILSKLLLYILVFCSNIWQNQLMQD